MARADSIVQYLKPSDDSEDDPQFAGRIRMTPDGKISVIDALKCILFTKQDGSFTTNSFRHASEAFRNVCSANEEVCAFIVHFRFPGQGQRDTPVTNRQGLTKIIMLLPGRIAAKFRDKVSVLLERYLNADRTLAEDILRRADVKDGAIVSLDEHPRVKSSWAAKQLNGAIKTYIDEHKKEKPGNLYPVVHDTNNLAVTGRTAAALRELYGAKGSSRNMNNEVQNAAMYFLQISETDDIKKTGDNPASVAKRSRELFEPVFKARGLHDVRVDPEMIRENAKVMRLAQKANRDGVVTAS